MTFRRMLIAGLCASLLSFAACDGSKKGDTGATGAPGTPAVDTATVSGTVKNSLSSAVMSGVSVSGAGVSTTTDATGAYTLTGLPVGAFTLAATMTSYTSYSASLSVVAGDALTQNISLAPTAAVIVTVAGAAASTWDWADDVALSATVACYDGRSDCTATWSWAQTHGVTATAAGGENAASETYTIGTEQAYKDNLFDTLLSDDLFVRRGASVSNRIFVQGINPFSLEEGIEAKFTATATMAYGDTASAEVTVTAPTLPYDIAPGLANVPRDRVAVLHGPTNYDTDLGGYGYTWSLTNQPASSALTSTDIGDSTTQHAYFTPDVMGTYTFEVTDGVASPVTIDVTAGDWLGAISGINASDGKPDSAVCEWCHDGVTAADKFTSWRESGHAHILTNNLNTSTHYSSSCFPCHTVGYDTDAKNSGIDEASDYSSWLASGYFNVPNAENWANTVAFYSDSATKANIQCENCHGPNLGGAHAQSATGDRSRISLSSDVCATCHGEPLRHARFQQWQESGHNNQHGVRYGDAETNRPPSTTSAGAGHCGRCHSSAGFRRWIKQDVTAQTAGNYIDLDDYIIGALGEVFVDGADNSGYQTALVSLGMSNQEATSQSCATCHMVHDPGSASGEPNDVKMRITSDDTLNLPAGFEASGLGHGTLCIACHNSRNGEHNDFAYDWDPNAPSVAPTTFMDSSTPHAAVQGDLLMGENAFFVNVGQRSKHSYIANSCANCHMELEPPPAALSYNLSGTNHTFESSTAVCTNCHGVYDGGTLESTIEARVTALETLFDAELVAQVRNYITDAVAASGSIRIVDNDGSCTETSMTVPADLTSISLGWGGATYVYAGNSISAPLGETDTTCTYVGMVEYNGAGAQLGLLIERALATGEYTGQALMKANWNITLLADDGSKGIHNPSFSQDVLNATEAVLLSLP